MILQRVIILMVAFQVGSFLMLGLVMRRMLENQSLDTHPDSLTKTLLPPMGVRR